MSIDAPDTRDRLRELVSRLTVRPIATPAEAQAEAQAEAPAEAPAVAPAVEAAVPDGRLARFSWLASGWHARFRTPSIDAAGMTQTALDTFDNWGSAFDPKAFLGLVLSFWVIFLVAAVAVPWVLQHFW
jgi:hypothetical protein